MPGRRFLVAGRVQGVGYRHFAATAARRLGLAGTVRNLPDGTVEVRAWGTDEALDLLESALQSGPRFASVTNVESSEISDENPGGTDFLTVG